MSKTSIEKFDYNLIRFLVTIIDTSSMANAAEVLNVAPSAVSYAVKKLREHYQDPLFIRALNGVKPTALALNLYEKFKVINKDIADALQLAPEDQSKVRKIFIRADTLTSIWVSHKLMSSGFVPSKCTLEFKYTAADEDERILRLRNQEVDIDIGLGIAADSNITAQSLFTWQNILICRLNHTTVRESITEEQFLREAHAIYSAPNNATILHTNTNDIIQARITNAILRSDSFMPLLLTAAIQDLLIIIPKNYFPMIKSILPMREVQCDFLPQQRTPYVLHMHKRNSHDERLKALIIELQDGNNEDD
jgi:DNA-binding transcriptional LysR family regulator